MSLGVGFEVSKVQPRPRTLSSCCLQICIQNSLLALQNHVCLHATMLPAMVIMDWISETVSQLQLGALFYMSCHGRGVSSHQQNIDEGISDPLSHILTFSPGSFQRQSQSYYCLRLLTMQKCRSLKTELDFIGFPGYFTASLRAVVVLLIQPLSLSGSLSFPPSFSTLCVIWFSVFSILLSDDIINLVPTLATYLGCFLSFCLNSFHSLI